MIPADGYMPIGGRYWPALAADAHTGELAAFDRDSGADLVDAVTASTALPGLVPTHSINGTRYIDGGVRSPDNADLALAMQTS
jgi:NTE family protein